MSFAAIRRQTNPLYLNFHGVSLEIIDHKGKPWVTAKDAGVCLQYADPARHVHKLFGRNKNRFKPDETAEIEIEVPYGDAEMRGQFDHASSTKQAMRKMRVRIFSLRGLNRLAIYANTPIAWEFHDWILDLIEGKNSGAELRQDHHRLATWFFESRPRWRAIHDLFQSQTYSFEEIARRVGISTASVRRAISLMHKRGLISDRDHRYGKESSRSMIGFWRDRQQSLPFV